MTVTTNLTEFDGVLVDSVFDHGLDESLVEELSVALEEQLVHGVVVIQDYVVVRVPEEYARRVELQLVVAAVDQVVQDPVAEEAVEEVLGRDQFENRRNDLLR